MRIFNELNGRNQGVYLVREIIKGKMKQWESNPCDNGQNGMITLHKAIESNAFEVCIFLCNDLLDIATLGEIEERREYDLEKEN